jgi:hypothetical protein
MTISHSGPKIVGFKNNLQRLKQNAFLVLQRGLMKQKILEEKTKLELEEVEEAKIQISTDSLSMLVQ